MTTNQIDGQWLALAVDHFAKELKWSDVEQLTNLIHQQKHPVTSEFIGRGQAEEIAKLIERNMK